jgi:hypothetical protein
MKKVSVVAIVVAIGFLVSSIGYAAWQGYGNPADVNALKQFQKETLPLRDELAAKTLDLQNEYAKQTPDQSKVATLQKEIVDLQTKIGTAAQKQGIPAYGPGTGYGYGYGMGPWMMGGYGGYYGMGPGMMYGSGYGRGPWMMGRGYGPGYSGGPGYNGGGYGYCPMW